MFIAWAANRVWMIERVSIRQWFCITCAIVLVACHNHHLTPVGGRWAVDYVTSMTPEPGLTRGDLVATHGKTVEVVDHYVWATQYYRPDCVGYWRFTHSRDEILFVCGDHRPLLVAATMNPDAWQLTDRGLEMFHGTRVIAGKALKLGSRYTVAALKAAAARTPLRVSSGEAIPAGIVAEEFTYDEGSDVNHRDWAGGTPLMVACGYGASEPINPAQVKALLDAGADVNAANVNGYTALMFAANEPEAVKVLLAYGANVNAVNSNHTTALIEASKDGNSESVSLLIRAGADVHLGGPGNTPLWWARSTQHDETARILEAAGARE